MKNPIVYLCNDPERALGLESILENFHIVCIDNSPMIPFLRKAGVKVFSLAEALNDPNPLEKRNTNRLLQHEMVQEYLAGLDSTPYLQVFKPAKNIEITAEQLGYNLLNTSSKLNQIFENKISQYSELSQQISAFPKTIIDSFANLTYESLISQLGEKFVIQFDRGHTGSGTIFIKTKDQFNELAEKFPNRIARFAKKIYGEAWTINGCITRYGTIADGLSYQITGTPELVSQEGGTIGNDWSMMSSLSEKIVLKIQELTMDVGDLMESYGYKGLFGLDFIINEDGEIYLIEINARQPASISMHNKLRAKKGLIPLSAFHIAEFIFPPEVEGYELWFNEKFKIKDVKETIKTESINNYVASQVFIRNINDHPVSLDSVFEMKDYSIETSEIIALRIAKDQLVTANSEIGRIQMLQSAMKNGKLKNDLIRELTSCLS